MKKFLLVLLASGEFVSLPLLASTNEPVQLLVPDGQLRSHPIRVFLDRDITTAMKPVLTLIVSHALLNHGRQEVTTNACGFLARNQTFTQEVRGTRVTRTGTLLLVDLGDEFRIPWYKAVLRVTPSLTWTEPRTDGEPEMFTAGGDSEIYLGNAIGAFIWTTIVMVVFIGFIWAACAKCKGSVLPLLSGPDGSLSLWRVQLLAWTAAVGSVVVCFGLTRLEVPTIPGTLVALMGMSLITGGLGYLGNREHLQSNQASANAFRREAKPLLCRLGELLCDEDGQVSVAKAQMVFWTLSILLLFFVKSFEESAVWEVPWTMVALMGVSQVGYVGPKFIQPPPGTPNLPPAVPPERQP